MNNFLIFDLIIAAVLVFFLWRGYSKGLVLTLCSFLAIFVALIGATVVSNQLTEPVSNTIQPIIEQKLYDTFREQIEQGDIQPDLSLPQQDQDTQEPNKLQLTLEQALNLLKDTPAYRGFADAVQKALEQNLVAASANAAKVISEYIARQVTKIALFVISFVLILILWFFFSHALDLTFQLPVLSTLNRWCGGVIGLAKGFLLVFLVCWLLKGSYIPQDAMENSYLLRFFCTFSPLAWLS